MIFFIDENFIEVVRETCYEGILTFCGPSREALLALKVSTIGEPVRLLGQPHNWALHIPEDQARDFVPPQAFSDLERMDRITGAALAYGYDFVLESSVESDGPTSGDYGYCWPDEVEVTKRGLFECEDPASDGVYFVPIWTLPNELTGAPIISLHEVEDEDVDGQQNY